MLNHIKIASLSLAMTTFQECPIFCPKVREFGSGQGEIKVEYISHSVIASAGVLPARLPCLHLRRYPTTWCRQVAG